MPVADFYLAAVLNSPLLWWYNWRTLVHLKDEALSPAGNKMEQLPIARSTDELQQQVEERVIRVLAIKDQSFEARQLLLDWLAVEHEVEKPSRRLLDPLSLSSDALVSEVRQARGKKKPLSVAALRNLRDEHARSIAPHVTNSAKLGRLEAELSDLVCQSYGLTAEEIALVWQTAPPRMPLNLK